MSNGALHISDGYNFIVRTTHSIRINVIALYIRKIFLKERGIIILLHIQLKLKLVAALTTFIAILKSILHLWLVCSFIIPFPHYYFCDQAYHINEIYQNINLPILQPSEDCWFLYKLLLSCVLKRQRSPLTSISKHVIE